MGHADHGPARRRIGAVRVARAPELVDLEVPVVVGVVDEEAPGAAVVGREGHRQQPALPIRRHVVGDVEEGLLELPAPAHDHDRPVTLNDEPAPVAARGGEEGGRVEAAQLQQAHRPLGRGALRLRLRRGRVGLAGRLRAGLLAVLGIAPGQGREDEAHGQDRTAGAHAASVWQRLTYGPLRAVAQFGSALRSGRRGRWFKSSQPDSRIAPHGPAGRCVAF